MGEEQLILTMPCSVPGVWPVCLAHEGWLGPAFPVRLGHGNTRARRLQEWRRMKTVFSYWADLLLAAWVLHRRVSKPCCQAHLHRWLSPQRSGLEAGLTAFSQTGPGDLCFGGGGTMINIQEHRKKKRGKKLQWCKTERRRGTDNSFSSVKCAFHLAWPGRPSSSPSFLPSTCLRLPSRHSPSSVIIFSLRVFLWRLTHLQLLFLNNLANLSILK